MLFVYLNRRFLNNVFKIGLNHGLFGGDKQLINVFYVHGNCNSILYLQVSYERVNETRVARIWGNDESTTGWEKWEKIQSDAWK
ncbi:hypothetical protein L2E82_39076 [Cichorium intybus]|uniref:Uncharacterized protein n=1 Tax=Cichorium intybus TaxID=13427 RepID=A0ACB9AII1_CICIN|nr:hypothetical protein L2E82_39076 [Cichorium intybus]